MEIVSAAASILALIEMTSNSANHIHKFFQDFVDGPLEVQNHCASIQALQNNLMELQALCSTAQLGTQQITQLSHSVRQCLAEVQIAEKRIKQIEKDLTADVVCRTWTKIKYGLIRGGPWLEKFFDRVERWNDIFIFNLVLLQL
jgi:hypothetical protein